MALTTEICVIGGGPAGSAIARRLAILGHEVLLIDRGSVRSPRWTESLPAGLYPLLDTLEMRDRVESIRLLRPHRTLLRWGADSQELEHTMRDGGLLVDRALFDDCLLNGAREAGARIYQYVEAGSCQRDSSGKWNLALRGGGSEDAVVADFIVDAAGRRGAVPPYKRVRSYRQL